MTGPARTPGRPRPRTRGPALLGLQQVDPGREHPLDGVGDPRRRRSTSAPATARRLLDRPSSISWRTISSRKNGLPSARRQHGGPDLLRQVVDVEQQGHQLARLVERQRIEGDDEAFRRPPPQVGRRSASVGPGGARRAGRAPPPGRRRPPAGRAATGPPSGCPRRRRRSGRSAARAEKNVSPRGVDLAAHLAWIALTPSDLPVPRRRSCRPAPRTCVRCRPRSPRRRSDSVANLAG